MTEAHPQCCSKCSVWHDWNWGDCDNFKAPVDVFSSIPRASLQHHLGGMSQVCPFCRAKFWLGERIECCYHGALIIAEQSVPQSLQQAILNTSVKPHIRQYNMALAMASVGHKNASLPDGTFVLSGKSYHHIGALLPTIPHAYSYAQIYILDTMEATARRQQVFGNRLQDAALNLLHEQLLLFNPHVREFRQAATSDTAELVWTCDSDIMGMQMGAIVAAPGKSRAIVLQKQDGRLSFISDCHQLYHSLAYPLLFPTGQAGWHLQMQRVDRDSNDCRKVSLTDYMRHVLMHRDSPTHVQLCGRLALEFYCDAWAQVEARAAMFHRLPSQQARYRVGRKCAVEDQLAIEGDLTEASIPMILPSSFVGSSKWYHTLYLDAMALPRRFHKPDLFITMTCNPKWPEITAALPPGSHWTCHPDIVARVFYLKFLEMMKDITERHIFGKVLAYVWRIEWQARGLPHVHLLLILATAILSEQQVDGFVSAELPDPSQDPELLQLVQDFMIHTPCDCNENAGCRQGKACKRHFPKDMARRTVIMQDAFPKYRRRGRHTCRVQDRIVSDDWVVPHNVFLLKKYRCHCNVEVASHIKCFKYVYKYVLKPPDHTAIQLNEIEAHLSGRLLSCSEAVWRFLGLKLHKEWPPITRLAIHLPNEQSVIFDPTADAEDIHMTADASTSTLLQWFILNQTTPAARQWLYQEIPEHFTFTADKKWKPRKNDCFSIGRTMAVSFKNQELFALRRLLDVVRGATDWVDLISVDGVSYDTFQEACRARGMLADDGDVIAAFQLIVATNCSLSSMRREFACLLLNRQCDNAVALFQMFVDDLSDNVSYSQ
jgi:Helitron helicase-like domain at N-terminus